MNTITLSPQTFALVTYWKAKTATGFEKKFSIKKCKTAEQALSKAKQFTTEVVTITGLLVHAETKSVLIG